MQLFVGSDSASVQGRPTRILGARCFSAAVGPFTRYDPDDVNLVEILLDSGTFTDVTTNRRLLLEEALDRQLSWERRASHKWRTLCQAKAIVSYDLLIDEKYIPGRGRRKERWTTREADRAVRATIEAAAFLAKHRQHLAPRRLVLSVQGVNEEQYAECCAEVLRYAEPGDIIGLGGWCILGRQTRWLPTFWMTLQRILPMIHAAGIRNTHLFGVLFPVALGGYAWLTDQWQISASTDNAQPVLACTRANPRKAGVRAPCGTWEGNVAWWRRQVEEIRHSRHYRPPPTPQAVPLDLFDEDLHAVPG